ncbi:MAG: hypothetical protein PHI88_02280 [Candidatus Pacebacteria bacterium]|nr:hypothetical protein [Candidatus Paceibacterota bacterium]
MEEDLFSKKIGRLQFYFRKNGSEVQIYKIFLNRECKIKNIREFPYEEEIEEARREAYKHFGLRASRRRQRR